MTDSVTAPPTIDSLFCFGRFDVAAGNLDFSIRPPSTTSAAAKLESIIDGMAETARQLEPVAKLLKMQVELRAVEGEIAKAEREVSQLGLQVDRAMLEGNASEVLAGRALQREAEARRAALRSDRETVKEMIVKFTVPARNALDLLRSDHIKTFLGQLEAEARAAELSATEGLSEQ
jgi:hypothetical protein